MWVGSELPFTKQAFWNTWLQCDTYQTIIISREEYPTLHFLNVVCLGKSINDSISSKSSWLRARRGTCTEGVACTLLVGCLPQLENSGPDPSLYLDDTGAVVTSVLSWGSANTVCDTWSLTGHTVLTHCKRKAKRAGLKHLCWAGSGTFCARCAPPWLWRWQRGGLY